MPSYYHYEVWKNGELLQKSYELYEDLTDICDHIDIMIYNYIGEMVKVDRYPAARSMLPRDSVLYYKAESGEEFHISMMEVVYPKK